MRANRVVYQVVRSQAGLPCIVRLVKQKWPEAFAPGRSLPSAPGATLEEETLVTIHFYSTIPCQPRLLAKSEAR